jgi:hypothetical protein
VSGHGHGFYAAWFDGSDDRWTGFGEDWFDDMMAGLEAETKTAMALAQAVPCIEPIPMDAYQTATYLAMAEAEQTGLKAALLEARAAGDAARIAEIERQIDAVFERFGAGDFPWRDPELAQAQLARRMLACSIASVQLRGRAEDGGVVMYAETSSSPGGVTGSSARVEAGSLAEGAAKLASEAARPLQKAHEKLFCSCQTVQGHCVTTNFEMGSQAWECTATTRCCDGRVVDTRTETGPGLRAGGGTKFLRGCCSELAILRAGTAEEDAEERALANEIWCEGTWNLRAGDMDCDGVPNAADPTPWPPEDAPDSPKAQAVRR